MVCDRNLASLSVNSGLSMLVIRGGLIQDITMGRELPAPTSVCLKLLLGGFLEVIQAVPEHLAVAPHILGHLLEHLFG